MFEKIETELPGVVVLKPKVFQDARGSFAETYHEQKFADLGITVKFVQDNHSRSSRGTLRGLHYQLSRPQAKLCRVVEGEVFDVAVDIRRGSPTFAKWVGVILSAEEMNQIFIPAGFAHGFVVLSEKAQFLYKCSDFYDPGGEGGVAWNDPELKIQWPITEPLLSGKDLSNRHLHQIESDGLPKYVDHSF
jgi:dTDP-4-dehydrorhamnose 3,5-epimerase